MTREEKKIQEYNIKIGTWLLGLYFFIAPLDFLPVINGISITKIIILIPILGNIIYVKKFRVHLDRFFIIPIFYIMVIIFTSFYSISFSDTLQRIITLVLNISVILFLSLRSYNIKEINLLKRTIVLSGWLVLGLTLIYFDTNIINGRLRIIINGYQQDPNYLTGFLIFSIIYYFSDMVKFGRRGSMFKIIILFVFIFLTGSRGGLIAVLCSILFYLMVLVIKTKLHLRKIFNFIVTSIMLGIFLGIIIDKLPQNLISRYTYDAMIGSGGTGRVDIWINIINQYLEFPLFNKLFGVGAGTVQHLTFGQVAHNIWIENLVEIGILGTSIYSYFNLTYLKKAFKIEEYVILSSFIGYTIMGLSMSLYSYKPLWNIMLLIMIIKNHEYQIMNNDRGTD